MRKILQKNLNLIKEFGIFGLFRIYGRGVKWFILSKKDTKVKVKVNDYYMYVKSKDRGVSKALFLFGVREKDQMRVIKNNLRHGAKVLDIGANIGYYVILESNIVGPSGKIIAYEPSEDTRRLLKDNVELNNLSDMVEIKETAVSDRSGTSTFYLFEKANINNLDYKKVGEDSAKEEKEVETVDIYEIINAHKDIEFIRMDIEGNEVKVLGRLAEAAKDFNVYPDILFETHYDSTRYDIGDRLKRLFQLGYFPSVFVSHHMQIPKLRERGYEPDDIIRTDMTNRAIFKGVSKKDALDFICNIKGSRAVLLKKG